MNFNATLIGQMITFAIFVWFCMKYIWPFLIQAMEERNKRISEGLAAAQQGQKDLEEAQAKVVTLLLSPARNLVGAVKAPAGNIAGILKTIQEKLEAGEEIKKVS